MLFRNLGKGTFGGLIVGVVAIGFTTCLANAAAIAKNSTLELAIASPNSSHLNALTSESSMPSVSQQNSEMSNIAIEPQFDEAGAFSSGRAWVRIGNKWGFIDKTGNIVIQPQFDQIVGGFSEGLAMVKIGDKLGYVRR